MAQTKIQTWAFDCEWVPDVVAGRRIYHLGSNIADDEVLRVMWEEGGATEDNPRPFLKTVLCRLVSIATVVRVEEGTDVKLFLWALPEKPDDPTHTEGALLTRFLEKYAQAHPLLVGYNSRASDLHILTQRAIVNGLRLPEFAHQMVGCKPWEMKSFDLMDVVGARTHGGTCSLNEIANLCGIPGKLDVTGNDVAGLFYGGRIREIVRYNVFDALTTYLVWLRIELFKGTWTRETYQTECARVRTLIQTEMAKPDGDYLEKYLTAWDHLQEQHI